MKAASLTKEDEASAETFMRLRIDQHRCEERECNNLLQPSCTHLKLETFSLLNPRSLRNINYKAVKN